MSTTQELHQVFATAFEIPVESITPDLEYQGIVEWDSMSHLLLVEELERFYNISISMEDILEMGNIDKIKAILKKNGVEIQ
jgi:acyl carrier protein